MPSDDWDGSGNPGPDLYVSPEAAAPWNREIDRLQAKLAELEAERNEMREVMELLMMDEWGYRETEAPDVQDALTERGILVERPAPQSFREEWDADTWFVFRWSDEAGEVPE